jgi:cyclic pyranopterin phosphate synthase
MPPDPGFTHFDDAGAARMVDVSGKEATYRYARAAAIVRMEVATADLVRAGNSKKGDVLQVARLAGIQASKRTGELIPLCHPLPLEGCDVSFAWLDATRLEVTAAAWLVGKTGVEMEAMVASTVAALTVYDMCKSVDRGMSIERAELCEKRGGKSGHYLRDESAPAGGDSA